jgi:hypothetical protein
MSLDVIWGRSRTKNRGKDVLEAFMDTDPTKVFDHFDLTAVG